MPRPVHHRPIGILFALYAVELSIGLILVALYKAPSKWGDASVPVIALLTVGGIGLVASAWALIRQFRSSGRRKFILGAATNLFSLFLMVVVSESVLRIASRTKPQGITVFGVSLRPTWPEVVARSREVIHPATGKVYFVSDPELGWTVGPNRESKDRFYSSSAEGLRSSRPGVRLAHDDRSVRIALVGDSNAFSLEVPFEESWGHYLEQELGGDAQVLNFGVDGFGIDQMYLRYRRDVRPWNAKVVIVAFIEHDLARTMAVYPMVSFGWPGYLVKPRFEVEGGELRLINMPLPTPKAILDTPRVDELPFVQRDFGYRATDWSSQFREGPFVFRILTSLFPRWPSVDHRQMAEQTKELNSRLLAALARSIEEDGVIAIIIYLPRWGVADTLARATIDQSGLSVLDMTECLSHVPADRRRVASGAHYTGLANLALARCTVPAVRAALRQTLSEREQDELMFCSGNP